MRVRDIITGSGAKLRIALEPAAPGDGPVIALGDPRLAGEPAFRIDLDGGALLAAFLLGARLSEPAQLAEERMEGHWPLRLRLVEGARTLEIELGQGDQRLRLPRALWDRLYIELQLALAHGHQWSSAGQARRDERPAIRMLH